MRGYVKLNECPLHVVYVWNLVNASVAPMCKHHCNTHGFYASAKVVHTLGASVNFRLLGALGGLLGASWGPLRGIVAVMLSWAILGRVRSPKIAGSKPVFLGYAFGP